MKRIWVHRAKSFVEAAAFDSGYYAAMTPEERLDIMQRLREVNFKLNREGTAHVGATRLRRHVAILKSS
jgi:hypothetical protein